MGQGSWFSCVKFLVFAFNFLFWVLGCGILGIGIWLLVDPAVKDATIIQSNPPTYTVGVLFVIVGVIMLVTGFLGCCGAIRESQCMLATFFGVLFVIFVLLLAGGIFALVKKDEGEEQLNEALVKLIKEARDGNKAVADNLVFIEKRFQCCGANKGLADYVELKFDERRCLEHIDMPCPRAVNNAIKRHFPLIAGIGLGVGIVLILGMIFSMLLCCAVRESDAATTTA